jgi:chromosomal replication initiation ATPase DnaA
LVKYAPAQKIKMGSDIPQKWRGGHWLTYKRKLKMTPEQKIRQLVEQIYKLDITNNCRESRFVQARLIYYKLCIQFGTLNQTNIAKSIGRNHATLIHAMKAMGCLYPIF